MLSFDPIFFPVTDFPLRAHVEARATEVKMLRVKFQRRPFLDPDTAIIIRAAFLFGIVEIQAANRRLIAHTYIRFVSCLRVPAVFHIRRQIHIRIERDLDPVMQPETIVTVKHRTRNQCERADPLLLKGTLVRRKRHKHRILRHESHIMRDILIPRINIDGVRFDAIVRYLRHRMFRREVAMLDHYVIGILVICTAFALKIVRPAVPAGHLFKMSDSGLRVIVSARRLEICRRILPDKLPRDDILLRDRISIDILGLVGIHHVLDLYAPESCHLSRGLIVAHFISHDRSRMLFGNPGIRRFLILFPVFIIFGRFPCLLPIIGRPQYTVADGILHICGILWRQLWGNRCLRRFSSQRRQQKSRKKHRLFPVMIIHFS